MSVHPADLRELKRLATNSYDNDKKFLNRVITGISDLEKEISALKLEIIKLKNPMK